MAEKNYAEVLIDGKIYTLTGDDDQDYLRKVASYISDKINEVRATPGYGRQNKDYQEVMIYLNLADDYFKAERQAELYKEQKEELEKEIYGLKHDVVSLQMKLDAEKEKNKKKKAKEEPEEKAEDGAEEKEAAEPDPVPEENAESGGDMIEPGDDKKPGEGASGGEKEPEDDGNTNDQSGQDAGSNVIVNVNSYSSKNKKRKKGH